MIAQKSSVKDFRREDQLFFDDKGVTRNGKKLIEQSSTFLALSVDNAQINYFNSDNEIITEVKEGTAYFTSTLASKSNLEIGDKFDVKIGNTQLTFSYAGIAKDAFLGSEMMGNSRILMNRSDYAKIAADEKASENNQAQIFYINGYDKKALASDLSDLPNVQFNKDQTLVRTSYIMNSIAITVRPNMITYSPALRPCIVRLRVLYSLLNEVLAGRRHHRLDVIKVRRDESFECVEKVVKLLPLAGSLHS